MCVTMFVRVEIGTQFEGDIIIYLTHRAEIL